MNDARTSTHFAVPGAQEWLLDEPVPCPDFGALTFDGLVIDGADRPHLVVRTMSARAHLGPDRDLVTRRALILAAGLHDGVTALPADRAAAVARWVLECWDAVQDEIREAALTRPRTQTRPRLRLIPGSGPTVPGPTDGADLSRR